MFRKAVTRAPYREQERKEVFSPGSVASCNFLFFSWRGRRAGISMAWVCVYGGGDVEVQSATLRVQFISTHTQFIQFISSSFPLQGWL